MMHERPPSDSSAEIASILHMAFGQPIRAIPIPVPSGYGQRGMAFRLDAGAANPQVPPYVMLLRYLPQVHNEALRVFLVLRALHEQGYCAPQPYFLGWTQRQSHVGLLVNYIQGRNTGGNPHPFFMRVGPDFARALAWLHSLRWSALPDLPVLPLSHVMDDLHKRIRALGTPELNQILDWLLQLVTRISTGHQTIIHGDYRLEHVIAQGAQVGLIYGWENAMLADPRFDVGYASATLSAYSIALSNQFIEGYTAHAGPVEDLVFWETLNALRILTRVATSLSRLPAPQRTRFLQRMNPFWQGVLAFVESRTGLPLLQE